VENLPDILINLIATVGMLGLWLSLRQRGSMSLLERRISYLAIAMMFMFFMRSWFWVNNSYLIERIALIPVVTIPFLVLIATEGLMRRHAPFVMKCLTAMNFIAASVVILLGHRQFEPWFSYGICAFQLLVFLFCLIWILTRKASDLTASENRSATVFALTLVSVSLVGLTDFPEIVVTPVRLGAVGVLIVAYILVLANSRPFSFRLVGLEIITILIAVVMSAWVSIAVLGVNNLEQAIVLGAVLDTLSVFLSGALAVKMTPYSAILGPKDLSDYNISNLVEAYQFTPVISVKMLREQLCSKLPKAACEQIEDILNQHQASHSFMASISPPLIVVSAAQPFGDEREFSTYLSLVSKIARLIKTEKTA